jgi:AbrB family looped-hinge helix DNA binding protein
METATLSSKYQIVVPRRVREALGLHPGERISFVVKGRSAHLVPVGDLRALRGALKGASTDDVRDRSDAE